MSNQRFASRSRKRLLRRGQFKAYTNKMKEKKGRKTEKIAETELAGALCKDRDCPFHGNLKVRGRIFEGGVIRKFHKRVTIEFERMIYVRKYERYAKKKTKIHARLPTCVENKISIGDIIRIQECRPLSKTIHFVIIKKIKNKENKK